MKRKTPVSAQAALDAVTRRDQLFRLSEALTDAMQEVNVTSARDIEPSIEGDDQKALHDELYALWDQLHALHSRVQPALKGAENTLKSIRLAAWKESRQ